MRDCEAKLSLNILFSGPGWVGWTNKKYPLEIGFVFTHLQSLQSVSIAVFNKPDMGIMVSCELLISDWQKYKVNSF